MKIRLARKILKHQPENDPIRHKLNMYWVNRWRDHEEEPPKVQDHRISKAIMVGDKQYIRITFQNRK